MLWMIAVFATGVSFAQQESPAVEAPKWLPVYRIRYPLRVASENGVLTNNSQSIVARLPTGGWLRPDGGDVVVQSQSGKVVPTAVVSHHTTGDTLIQFKREGNELFYWAYAVSPDAPGATANIASEGMFAEFREWKGDVIDSWASVVTGLKKSDIVNGNAWVPYVAQNESPIRPDNPRNFATSFRGFLSITNSGYYRFMVNADDASFLFINNFKVFERTGSNIRMKGRVDTNLWVGMKLDVGIYPIEIYQICGNNPSAEGFCTLLWMPPGALHPALVPSESIPQPLFAEVTGVEEFKGEQAAVFAFGVDDSLNSEGVTFYLAKFEAQGNIRDPSALQWDLGDGTTDTGRTVTHIYFKPGEYKVSLKSGPNMPSFTKMVYVWEGAAPTSPASLAIAAKILSGLNWSGWDIKQINTTFDFLMICEQPGRWPMIEKLARYLLDQPGADPERRVIYHTALMQAVAEQGRGVEAIKLMDKPLTEFTRLPSLEAQILMAGADINWKNLRDFTEASRLYEKLVTEHKSLGIPLVRQAAIHWGDLFTESGQIPEAADRYRLAQTLGGDKFKSTAQTDAIKMGAMLRVAEQKLRSGDVRESRKLLEQIEIEAPEQKLQGLYRFLRAEADRYAGRYEDAIRNYEVLIKLTQWSGFRDRAFFGIADCYYRMESFDKAIQWLDSVKESYPDYYRTAKVDEYRRVVDGRIQRLKAAKEDKNGGTKEEVSDISIRNYVTGFEPEEKTNPGRPDHFKFLPTLGMIGPYVGYIQGLPSISNFAYFKRLRNMRSNAYYWIEFWYREQEGYSNIGPPPTFTLTLQGAGNSTDADEGSKDIAISRTYGQWRKAGAKLKTPVTQDGLLKIDFLNVYGVIEIDGLKILAVSDRENDSLRSFIEGTTEQH